MSHRTNTTEGTLTRLNVNLNQETANALKELAQRQNISLTEAIRRAVAVLKFVDEESQQGRRIQTVDKNDEHKRELILM